MNWLKASTLVFIFSVSSWAQTKKEWTMLVYINGHNNLSSFGEMNIKSMERVGSTPEMNIAVEWGTQTEITPNTYTYSTQRLYIEKSKDPKKVTSPILQDFKNYDMGDYRNLQNFLEWGVKTYPARHYFVVVWNHGAGWRFDDSKPQEIKLPKDISFDDSTDNYITTEQMGQVMAHVKNLIGKNVDIYGSDACLMQMIEVVGEMKDSVDYVVGSQENEPGEGWPYFPFLNKWSKTPMMTPSEVSILLSKEYKEAYTDHGQYGERERTTFSVLDVSQVDGLYLVIKDLAKNLLLLTPAQIKKARTAILSTTRFATDEYVDLSDYMDRLAYAVPSFDKNLLNAVKARVQDVVLTSDNNENYFPHATGLSIWLPMKKSKFQNRYDQLQFSHATGWNQFVQLITK